MCNVSVCAFLKDAIGSSTMNTDLRLFCEYCLANCEFYCPGMLLQKKRRQPEGMQSAADYGWSGNFRELDDRLQGMQLRHRESWMLFIPKAELLVIIREMKRAPVLSSLQG
jgi:hypothetical protein